VTVPRGAPDHASPAPAGGGAGTRGGPGADDGPWWSRRLRAVLESSGDRERMRRGRELARRGRVTGLTVRPHEVGARVRGPGTGSHEVAVGIAALDEDAWRAVEAGLASRPDLCALLSAGTMPGEIERVFAGRGVRLLPESVDDLHVMCDCPGYGGPCEHAAAVLHLMAEAVGRDPFLLLEWRGRPRERLLAALRRRGGRRDAGPADPFDAADEPLTAEDFWAPRPSPADPREDRPAVPGPPDLLLRLLDPPAVSVRRRSLVDALAPAYAAMPNA